MKAIINMTTAFLLLLMFLFGWSLVTYNESPEKYQWLDANGDFKTETYDLTVSYNLDTPQDDLNGNSLNDVFSDNNLVVNGDFSNGTTSWSVTSGTMSVVNGVMELTNVTNFGRIYQTNNAIINNDYYVRGEILYSLSGLYYYQPAIRNFVGWDTVAPANQLMILSDVTTFTTSTSFFRIDCYGQIGNVASIDNLYLIDLTALGINQTKNEMDYWYSEYQRLQENQIENYKELGSTVESSWQFLVGYFNTLGDIIQGQVNFVLDTLDFISGVTQNIITVPIFGGP